MGVFHPRNKDSVRSICSPSDAQSTYLVFSVFLVSFLFTDSLRFQDSGRDIFNPVFSFPLISPRLPLLISNPSAIHVQVWTSRL